MKLLLLLLLLPILACAPTYLCETPCQGQSAQETREGGILCDCIGLGPSRPAAAPPMGAQVLLKTDGFLIAKFGWTDDTDLCGAYQDWWAKVAPLPCKQPGGGAKRQQP